jgi:hypothetical protein
MKIYSSILQRKGTFMGMSAYLKISGQPQLRLFASPIVIEKLIKTEGPFLVKLTRGAIQNQNGCCTFQMSLVYNRVCWGFVWCGYGLSVLKNEPRRLSDFPGHFWGPGGRAGWFLRGFGVRGSSGRVVWGDKPKTRHFSGSLGCVGLQHP